MRFVVERTLENDFDRLKEFVVALEVFDRDENYDPNVDSIVRVEARRLRAKLRTYYEGQGSGDSVIIALRPGSYVPSFEARDASTRPQPLSPAPISEDPAEGVTVAVLPFLNISPEPEQDYFCDGITEEIINALAAVDGLSVVARTSAFQFKGKAVDIREVGEKLAAQVVVEGSVRKAGSQLRITAQAINAARGYHLWSETFRREIQDVFLIQEEISRAIADVLRIKLRPGAIGPARKAWPSLDAYTGFLQGRFLLRQETTDSLQRALEQFRKVVTAFPDYAPPYLLMTSLWEAVVLVVLVSLIGFWEWRSALLMAVSIPITLALTFGMMDILGVDIQQVSIASLIIALGLLVDDPVVAGDSIKRDLALGHPPVVAAWLGPTKLARAILFATITNIVAYLPFLLLEGDTGRFIYMLPVVITCALVASRIASMTSFRSSVTTFCARKRSRRTVTVRSGDLQPCTTGSAAGPSTTAGRSWPALLSCWP